MCAYEKKAKNLGHHEAAALAFIFFIPMAIALATMWNGSGPR